MSKKLYVENYINEIFTETKNILKKISWKYGTEIQR